MLVRILVLLGAGLLAYFNALPAPKVLDDLVSIDANPQIRDLWSLTVFQPERELPVAGRPLPNLTLAINYALDGTRVTGYRVVNLLFHIVCGMMAFLTIRQLLLIAGTGVPAVVVRGRSTPDSTITNTAFAAALIWMLHPLNSEVVNYITQRTESMMATFYLLTLYASMRALEPRGGSWTAAAVAACSLGALCKESMATAPLMVMLFDRTFVFASWREAWRARRGLYAGLALSWVVLAWLMASGPRVRSAGFDAGVGVWTYLLNQTVMIVRYLRLAVWPDSLVVWYGWPRPYGLGDVLPYGLAVLALLTAAAVAFRFRPWLGFAGAWLFITLAPSSSFVPIATEVGAERRMYLPLLGLIVPVCAALAYSHVPRRALVAAATAITLAFGATTAMRNREYLSSLTLAQVTLERWPTAAARHTFGEQLIVAGRGDEALPYLRAATNEAPRAHFTLGMYLLEQGRQDEAMRELRSFIERQPLLLQVPDAHFAIARIHAQRQNWADAAAEVRLGIDKAPGNADARRLLADVLLNAEDASGAATAYANYLRLRPGDVDAWTNLGVALASHGRMPEAVNAFRRAAEINPNDGQAQRNLATVLLDAGRPAEAEMVAQRAAALRPDDPVARELLAQARALQRR